MTFYDPDTGILDDKQFIQWLDLHNREVVKLLAQYFKEKSILYKNLAYDYGYYYGLLWGDAMRMYAMLVGLDEM